MLKNFIMNKKEENNNSDELDFWGLALKLRFIGGMLILITLLGKLVYYLICKLL